MSLENENRNRWKIYDTKKEMLTFIILRTIDKISKFEPSEESDSRYEIGTDLSSIGVGPYHVKKVLEELGYKEDSFSKNGWEMDYWFHFQHPDPKFPPLCLSGTAIIHEMYLRGEEEDYKTYEEREEELRNDPEFQNLINKGMELLAKTEEILKES